MRNQQHLSRSEEMEEYRSLARTMSRSAKPGEDQMDRAWPKESKDSDSAFGSGSVVSGK